MLLDGKRFFFEIKKDIIYQDERTIYIKKHSFDKDFQDNFEEKYDCLIAHKSMNIYLFILII